MAIQIRRGTDAEWESNKSNIVAGEPAIAMDTERVFVGTGTGTYVELANIDFVEKAMKEVEYSNFELQSVKGDIVSFPNGAGGIPVKELQVDIKAVQDLHGYDAPWVGGAGKNKLPFPYAFSSQTVNGVTFTIQDDGGINVNGTATASTNIKLLDTTDKYEGIQFRVGLGSENVTVRAYNGSSGVANSNNNSMSGVFTATSTFNMRLVVTNGTTVNNEVIYPRLYLSTETDYTYAPYENICPISGWTGANIYVSPTADEEDANVYPITWQTEAGTVYGGTLDVTTGVLTLTHKIVDLGSKTWTYTSNRFRTASPSDSSASVSYGIDALCSCYKRTTVSTGENGAFYMNNSSYSSTKYIVIFDSNYTDVTAFKNSLSGQTIVYPIATPQTVQLTPTEVTTLLGQNNIWCDTGAIEELTYRISNVQ